MEKDSNKLHLGCGHIIKEGWINHDIAPLPGVDIVHDLRIFPWPFEDRQFEEIYADNVLEHLHDTVKTMEEIYRITKLGAKIFIGVPFWNSFEAWGDPTHERLFSEEIFEFFDPTTWRGKQRVYYTNAKFKIEKIVYCVNPFKPLSRNVSSYRFGRKISNPFIKMIIRLLGTYFSNVIHGLDVYLMRL
ncbi:MAG: class I SAM-dependent methyltransferase [Ignavibacteriaceae bacterium]